MSGALLVTGGEDDDENNEYVPEEEPEFEEPMMEGKAGIEMLDEDEPVAGEAEKAWLVSNDAIFGSGLNISDRGTIMVRVQPRILH